MGLMLLQRIRQILESTCSLCICCTTQRLAPLVTGFREPLNCVRQALGTSSVRPGIVYAIWFEGKVGSCLTNRDCFPKGYRVCLMVSPVPFVEWAIWSVRIDCLHAPSFARPSRSNIWGICFNGRLCCGWVARLEEVRDIDSDVRRNGEGYCQSWGASFEGVEVRCVSRGNGWESVNWSDNHIFYLKGMNEQALQVLN